ncbi:MAG: PUA domain-containing protein [Thermoleophilaceae bacterium]
MHRADASPRSSCGCATPSRRTATWRWTRGRSGRCASGAPACCPSESWGWPARFSAGDAVTISSAEGGGRAIGKGIVNYSAGELRQVKGMKSAAVLELLPRAADEAIHRDYLVLE